MVEFLQDWWGVMLAAAGAVMGYTRLEVRAAQNSATVERHIDSTAKALKEQSDQHTADLEKLEARIDRQRQEDMERRAQDWGRMEKAIDEMRSDIKLLLKRGG